MTEATTQETTAQKDEHGIDIVTGPYETWAFLDTPRNHNFFARFLRLVNVNGVRYAEIEYARYRNGPRKVRWCPLTDFKALKNCQPGDDTHCLWLLGKPYVIGQAGCKSGRVLTQKEWDAICDSRQYYPEFYNQLVEA